MCLYYVYVNHKYIQPILSKPYQTYFDLTMVPIWSPYDPTTCGPSSRPSPSDNAWFLRTNRMWHDHAIRRKRNANTTEPTPPASRVKLHVSCLVEKKKIYVSKANVLSGICCENTWKKFQTYSLNGWFIMVESEHHQLNKSKFLLAA